MHQFTDIFIATSFFFFFLSPCLMGSLPNIDTELFYFIAAKILPLIKVKERRMKAYGLSTLFLQEKPIIKVLGFKILFRENAFLSPEENVSGALFTCVFLFLSSSPHPSPRGIHQLRTTLGGAHTWIKSYFCLFYTV